MVQRDSLVSSAVRAPTAIAQVLPPFPLMTRDDVASNATMIKDVIVKESMPPWYATRSQWPIPERHCIIARAEAKDGGLDRGRLSIGRFISRTGVQGCGRKRVEDRGKPDLIVTMAEEHTIPATGFVAYKYVVLPHLFFADTWVEAFEIKPLNPSIVHHCNMAYATKDGANNETFITGYVPGGQPMDLGKFDNGVAYRIPAGAVLGLQIHYTTTGRC